ncbi:tissue factor pathway inhibitor a isoform X2 [Tachysurus fulvidraco]|uniref:tissue factor pathway inhibitor a isoform X2 n=1 Tax=Tachysurus fulvidraco TaxID=1234273 RepID=UPI001FEEDC0F|nr:tissue factor pathway inhibitor a isoform X2 [Tachysurus fulvidraco]
MGLAWTSLRSDFNAVLIVNPGLAMSVTHSDGEQPQRKIFHQWCALKKDEGPCKALKDRFYFDMEMFRCEPFEYGGCQGNENNFETIEECEEMCLVKTSKSPCHLGDEPGPCRAVVPRYFFDSKVNECRCFFYGGCFGNANNFKTLKECKDRCQRNDTEEPQNSPMAEEKIESYGQPIVLSDVHTEIASHTQPLKLPMPESSTETVFVAPDYCQSFLDKGECGGMERRFFYNPRTSRCHAFHYSGCGGNKNNFVHKRMCMKTCMKDYRRNGRIRIKTKNSNILFRSI